jgi:beta-glucanase (GH16 family)
MPKGKHLWPAIWMLPRDSAYGTWPRSGEIDIGEYRGQKPQEILGTIHLGRDFEHRQSFGSGERSYNFDFSRDFHTFGLDWSPKKIQWMLDGNVFYEVNIDRNFDPSFYTGNGQPFDKNFYLILNLAVGGNFFGNEPFSPDEARNWEKNTLEIDWVKKYEWR